MNNRIKKVFLSLIISCSILFLSQNINATAQSFTKGTIFDISQTFNGPKNDISSTTIDKYEVEISNIPGMHAGETEIINVTVNGDLVQFTEINSNRIKLTATFPAMPKNDEITITIKLKVLKDCSLDLDLIGGAGLSNHKWYNTTESTSGGCPICGGTSTPISGNPTFISYPIIYDANGGSGIAPTESNKETGDVFVATNNTFVAPANHSFLKWNTQADGNGTSYLPGSNITMPNDALILYAIWKNDSTNPNGDDNKRDKKNKNDKNKKTKLPIPKTGSDISLILTLSLVSTLSIALYSYRQKRINH